MNKFLKRLTKPGNLSVEACAGSFSIGKASILFEKDRRFVGCEVDSSFVTEAILRH